MISVLSSSQGSNFHYHLWVGALYCDLPTEPPDSMFVLEDFKQVISFCHCLISRAWVRATRWFSVSVCIELYVYLVYSLVFVWDLSVEPAGSPRLPVFDVGSVLTGGIVLSGVELVLLPLPLALPPFKVMLSWVEINVPPAVCFLLLLPAGIGFC